MAINRNYSYNPVRDSLPRSSSIQVAGDVTGPGGSGTSTNGYNLGVNSGTGTPGVLVPSNTNMGSGTPPIVGGAGIPEGPGTYSVGAGAGGPAADQTYMPAFNQTYMPPVNQTYMPAMNQPYMSASNQNYTPSMDNSGSMTQPSVAQLLTSIVSMVSTIVQELQAKSGLNAGNSSQLPSTSLDPNAGLTDPNAGLTDPNAGLTDPSATTGNNATGYPTGLNNATADPTQKAALDQSLSQIATDPVGSKLLNKAAQLGVKIEVGDPAAAAGANDVTVKGDGLTDPNGRQVAKDGTVVVNGVTLSDNKTGQITVVVRDPSNLKTIAHEMVHAVTTQDGNSKQEEGIADVIGSHVATDLGDTQDAVQGTDQQIYTNKQQYYPTLQDSNTIRQDLAAIGISTDV